MPKLFHIVFPGLLAITLCTSAGADDGARATIEEVLEERGWSVHRTFAGDLYLFAPSKESAAETQKAITPLAKGLSSENLDLQALGNKLETSGWKVVRKADGTLELHPRETTKATARKKEPEPSPLDEQWKQMQQQLKAAGWDAAREADGSLVLIPPGDPAQTATPEKEETAPEKQANSMQTMQEKLKESGWQVSENSDGSILFYPPEQQPGERGTIRPAHGHTPPADFNLPVNSWSQARTLTQKWLKQQSPGNLMVGKIREIYEVYLISILSNSGSSGAERLKHQIAIRKSDGHIIVLN